MFRRDVRQRRRDLFEKAEENAPLLVFIANRCCRPPARRWSLVVGKRRAGGRPSANSFPRWLVSRANNGIIIVGGYKPSDVLGRPVAPGVFAAKCGSTGPDLQKGGAGGAGFLGAPNFFLFRSCPFGIGPWPDVGSRWVRRTS